MTAGRSQGRVRTVDRGRWAVGGGWGVEVVILEIWPDRLRRCILLLTFVASWRIYFAMSDLVTLL